MRIIVLLFIAVILIAHTSSTQAKTMIGRWEVTTDKRCAILDKWVNDDKSEEMIGMIYSKDGKGMYLGFGDSKWKLKKGEELRIGLGVDEEWEKVVDGYAVEAGKILAFVNPIRSVALNGLMRGHDLYMEVEGKGEGYAYAYALDDDTTRALEALDACRYKFAKKRSSKRKAPAARKPASKPAIKGTTLSANKDGSNPQLVFDDQTPKIHLNTQIAGVPDNAVLRFNWVAVNTWVAKPNSSMGQMEVKASRLTRDVKTWITKPSGGWPGGDLRVEISIDGKILDVHRFSITSPDRPIFTDSVLSLNEDHSSPQTVFGTLAPAIYFKTKVTGLKSDVTGHLVWLAAKTEGLPADTTLASIESKMETSSKYLNKTIESFITPPEKGWWVGDYEIVMAIGDDFLVLKRFRIE